MENPTAYEQVYFTYIEKQKKFKNLVKDVQYHINLKEYKKQGYSFDEFVKTKWNISKAQAYRYLISAKVLDQLEEFEIQPSYERLCRSLHSCAKTTQQMKLLWRTILNIVGTSPDNISTLFVSKIWKELCNDKKYSHICHYEEALIDNIEKTLNKYSKTIKHKRINSKQSNNIIVNNTINNINNNNINNNNTNNINNNIIINSSNYYNNYNNNQNPNNSNNNNNNNNNISNITQSNNNNINTNNNTYNVNTSNSNNTNYNIINNNDGNTLNYSSICYISSPVSSEPSIQSYNNNQYIIYNNPTLNTKVIEKSTQNNNLLSPTDSISFSYNTNNNNIIKNVDTQNNIPIIITTTATNTNSIPQYLPSPNIDQCQKQVQYVQSYITIPNLTQNSVIYYY